MTDPLDDHISAEMADPLRAARGILTGCLIALPIWALIIWAISKI